MQLLSDLSYKNAGYILKSLTCIQLITLRSEIEIILQYLATEIDDEEPPPTLPTKIDRRELEDDMESLF